MQKLKYFKSKTAGRIPLPIFFPDATKAVVRTLDSNDIANTKTPGVLVNTYHLFNRPGKKIIRSSGGISKFMNWNGAVISDSGGFQIMTLAKEPGTNGKITDKGVTFKLMGQKKFVLTPEDSIDFQVAVKTDLMVVLDDFTPPSAGYDEAKKTVVRTLLWAKKSKDEFKRLMDLNKVPKTKRPYLIGVVQGGKYQDLRKYCTEALVEIGFDGLGYGGWPMTEKNSFDFKSAQTIKDATPPNYLLYGLGIGKPHEIVDLVKMGYHIFDCVLPTRDARHGRLYVFNSDSIENINLERNDFYSYFVPGKQVNNQSSEPCSRACDCLLCKNYSRAYLHHLFKENEITAMRLATIHNLRFYSMLMEKLSNIS